MATFEISEDNVTTITYALQQYAYYWGVKADRTLGAERDVCLGISENADKLGKWFEGRDLPLPVSVAPRVVTEAPKAQPRPSGGLKVVSEPRAPAFIIPPPYGARASGGNDDIDF